MKLEVDSLTKKLGANEVLHDISLSVSSGMVLGLSGVNGSGKTMLMRAMLGLIRPTSGCVRIDGKVLGLDLPVPPSVGFLLESPACLDWRTGYDNLRLIAEIKGSVGAQDIRSVLYRVGLDPDDKRRFRKYSLGMKQRLGIAAAVMEHPDLVILDEPTNALDSSGVMMVQEVIASERQRGAAVVMACHDDRILKLLADEVYFLAEGHIDGHEVRGSGDVQ